MRAFPRVPRDPYVLPSYSQMYWSASALATLAAGYIGSGIVGFLFIVSAGLFRSADESSVHVGHDRMESKHRALTGVVDIVASKAAALVIHFGLLLPIFRVDHWT